MPLVSGRARLRTSLWLLPPSSGSYHSGSQHVEGKVLDDFPVYEFSEFLLVLADLIGKLLGSAETRKGRGINSVPD
jgi:hypothetical protein